MQWILGCPVSDALLDTWAERIVFEREPLLLTEEACGLLPAGTVILSAKEFSALGGWVSLDFHDSYDLYAMRRQGLQAALLTPAEFRSLPPSARTALMRLQAERGRGQIYGEAFVRELCQGRMPEAFKQDLFETDGGLMLALRHDAWRALSGEARRRWLAAFVPHGRQDCLSATLRDRLSPSVRALSGTFAPQSGPNCFATALAAVTDDPVQALSIAGLWLHPEPLLRGLDQRGFKARPMHDHSAPGSVLLFADATGRVQHACFALGEGLALNKDSQAWYAPRQIQPLTTVLENWLEPGWSTTIYTRE